MHMRVQAIKKDQPSPFSFPLKAAVQGKMIEQLDVKLLDGVADIWTMSPPCQPFTKCTSAKQLGSKDNRSKAFVRALVTIGIATG